eukprot:Nitzschia sp. Nitz4//scaffold5_size260463//35725//36753//NITZ4_000946-RA/size260463-processed-gene-0.112-mRNA-1//-1//CDS//3329555232//3740//frame0
MSATKWEIHREELLQKPLAFTSDDTLVPATSRQVLEFVEQPSGKSLALNVEIFSTNTDNNAPVLLFIPGVCESTETVAVQNIAKYAKENRVKLAVLEYQGHGISDGTPALCVDWDTLLLQALLFVSTISTEISTKYVICGSSLGGVLALYTAAYITQPGDSQHFLNPRIVTAYQSMLENLTFHPSRFLGVVPVSPAIGVHPQALPPGWMVSALGVAASSCPSSDFSLTPYEDSSHYNCPSSTARNFSGHWPLGTSKMLLGVTSERVPSDIRNGFLTLANVPMVLLFAGNKDHVIPLSMLQEWADQLQCPRELEVWEKAGHDVLYHSSSTQEALEKLFSLLDL